MIIDKKYKGIFFMLLAALGFSIMGGAAKSLKGSFSAGQLVFFRNLVGLIVLVPGLLIKRPIQPGGKFLRLAFRGIMGSIALYTLLGIPWQKSFVCRIAWVYRYAADL